MVSFKHFDLRLLNPAFDSPLVDVLNELEYLRRLNLSGSTPAATFFQLKRIFHMLESLGSARIEGNHTTLADYVETAIDAPEVHTEQFMEIENIEKAMAYVEESIVPGAKLSEQLIRELHLMTVQDLKREGDKTPGSYRLTPIRIAQSEHLPPDAVHVGPYMRELVDFVNREDPRKYDLIKIALAHHRFGWIHPFSNGNGRVVRLMTYAMLIKYGFNVADNERLLNPTAVFCNDRERYYEMLSCADAGSDANLEKWCVYVLQGVLVELQKVDRLADYTYLTSKILTPALAYSKQRQFVTPEEHAILLETIKLGVVKAADLSKAMPRMSDTQRTYQIRKLVDRKMLVPVRQGARQYTIGFTSSFLIRGVIHALSTEEFISAPLAGGLSG